MRDPDAMLSAEIIAEIQQCRDAAMYYDAAESPQWSLETAPREANASRLRTLEQAATARGLLV